MRAHLQLATQCLCKREVTALRSISAKIEKLSNLSSLLMTIKSTSEARMQAEETQRLALQTYDAFEQHEKFGEVASAQDLYDTKKGEHQTAQTNLGIINDKVNNADSTYNRIREVLQQRSIAYAENLEILEFVDVIKKNDEDVSLEIYVLQHIFEQVLESANMRFTQLLDGRYQLVSSDTAKGGGKKGLDINVLDLAQNQERVVKTLSGGETFCASLALALGLADVVQAKAGGISIDTLFIDEGFSTLDSDRLDIVMGMLEGIQSLGRTIGIISHVDELKARIPERINVHVLGTGMPSTLSVTWN